MAVRNTTTSVHDAARVRESLYVGVVDRDSILREIAGMSL
ncbi:hypothetical protein EDD25_1137 [Cryobacterium psychrophilum]|nr:hypothetical protein EDD25_1137 [Cryobacterium psychrophilum]